MSSLLMADSDSEEEYLSSDEAQMSDSENRSGSECDDVCPAAPGTDLSDTHEASDVSPRTTEHTSDTLTGKESRCVEDSATIEEVCPESISSSGRRGRRRGRWQSRRSSNSRGGEKRASISTEDDGWVLLRNVEDYQPWIKPFVEPTGYRGDKEMTNAKPVDFLSLFLTENFWKLITEETNRYARQFLASEEELKVHSRFHQWTEVSVSEMKAFIALHLSMGLVEKAEIEDYWASFWPTYTPGFAKIMSRNRFEIIQSFLHFADNNEYIRRGQQGHDRLFKIRPIIDLIVPRFAKVYSPHKELSLDEMTITFKERSLLKQYNPQKIGKGGYRAYVLSESKTGYVLQWSLYTGQNFSDENQVGATNLIVSELMGPYKGKGHEVYMDSYYTSPTLANELAQSHTGLCGTVNPKRGGMPRCMRPTELPLKKGDYPAFARNGKLLACAWHDTKRITMLSSIHGNSSVPKCFRTKISETGLRFINRPLCMDMYNRFMGGVDRADQRTKTYIFPHRSRKWYNRIFNAILSISVINAHIISTPCTPGPHKPLKAFIQSVITALLEGYAKKESKKGGRPPAESGELPQRLTERHWLYETHERPDCAVCSDRSRPKGRRQTQFRCRQCGVGLCAVPCNEMYHTLKDFKLCHLDR